MKNKFTWTRQHNILTKGTANSILRFKEGARYACPRHSSTDCWDFEFQYLPFQMPRIFKKQRKQPSPLQEVFSSIHGNCIRSHAFYKISKTCWVPGMEREIVTKTLIENNCNKKEKKKKKKVFATFSQKDKGFKNKHLDLASQNQWQFLQCSCSWLNRSIYTVLLRLNALDKCYLNTSQVHSKVVSSLINGQTALELEKCCSIWAAAILLKVIWVENTVQLGGPSCTACQRLEPCLQTLLHYWLRYKLELSLHKVAFIQTERLYVMQWCSLTIYKQKYASINLEKRKPNSHLAERNTTVPLLPMNKSSLITTVLQVTGGSTDKASWQKPLPNLP